MPSRATSPVKSSPSCSSQFATMSAMQKLSFSHQSTKDELGEANWQAGGWNNSVLFWERDNVWLRTQTEVYLFHLMAFSHQVVGLIWKKEEEKSNLVKTVTAVNLRNSLVSDGKGNLELSEPVSQSQTQRHKENCCNVSFSSTGWMFPGLFHIVFERCEPASSQPRNTTFQPHNCTAEDGCNESPSGLGDYIVLLFRCKKRSRKGPWFGFFVS